MATALTFQIGRRPGIVRRQSPTRGTTCGMTSKQRNALSELVHGPERPSRSSSYDRRPSLDVAWVAVLALVFVLSGRTLFEGVRFVHTADTLRAVKVAEPQVDVTITRLPPTETVSAATPVHSSATVSRTM